MFCFLLLQTIRPVRSPIAFYLIGIFVKLIVYLTYVIKDAHTGYRTLLDRRQLESIPSHSFIENLRFCIINTHATNVLSIVNSKRLYIT